MLRFLLKRTPIKRLARGVPVVGLLSAAEVAKLARDHLAMLAPAERKRMLALLAKARGGSGAFSGAERAELAALGDEAAAARVRRVGGQPLQPRARAQARALRATRQQRAQGRGQALVS